MEKLKPLTVPLLAVHLGQHGLTDAAFEQALAAGTVRWNPAIEDKTKLFRKI